MTTDIQARADRAAKALEAAGIGTGDTVLVHSALSSLGAVDKRDVPGLCEALFNGITSLLGSGGTLLVPTYFYEYARQGIPYDVARSPVSRELGTFSAYMAKREDAVRSKNPTTNLTGVGAQADHICGQATATGYGAGSPWARLTEAGGKIAGIGTRFNTMTYVHYIEQVYGVPHMYHKYFRTPVYDDGQRLDVHVINYVRYLKYGIKAEMLKFEKDLRERGLVRFVPFGDSHVYAASCAVLLEQGLAALERNPFHFLERTPEFEEGEPPLV